MVPTILLSPMPICWVLTKDGKEHPINQWQFEDQLMAQIERV